MGKHSMLALMLLVSLVGRASSFKTYTYNGNDYIFSSDSTNEYKYTWYDARAYCLQRGADLITIENTEEDNWIKTVRPQYRGGLWIGYNKLSGEWTWVDGKTSPIIGWSSSHPMEGYLCAYRGTYSSTTWYSRNCGEKKGILCKRPAGLSTYTPKTTTVTSLVSGYCPTGYISSRTNRCFKLSETTKKWSDAQADCRKDGHYLGELACFTDEEEDMLITMLMKSTQRYHIGLRRTSSSYTDVWTWADNSKVDYTNWNSNPSSSTYGYGYIYGFTGKWYSTTSSYTSYRYICQVMKDPGNVISTPSITLPHSCTGDYIPYGKGCYKILRQKADWANAIENCHTESAELVDIHSAEENAAIQYMMYMGKVDTTWTGFRFNDAKQQYLWSSNWYVVYTEWGSGQPKRETGGGCVSFHVEDGEWYDTNCNTQLNPICKTTTAPPVTAPPEKEGRCINKDWMEIGGHCYASCEGIGCNRKWIDQAAACKKLHPTANLASIHDFVTQEQLRKSIYAKDGFGYFWIGMYRSAGNNLLRWIDDTEVEFTNWYTNEPNEDPDSGKDCVYMYSTSTTSMAGKWYTYTCDYARGYLCKMEKLPPLTTPAPVEGTCPGPTWEKHGGTCYLFRPDEFATWEQAQGHCITEGGSAAKLAMIEDEYNNELIHTKMIEGTSLPVDRNFWIGLSRKDEYSSFIWLDGTNSSTGFNLWDVGKPTDKEGTNCGQVNIKTMFWHNEKCDIFTGYACQVPVLRPGESTPGQPTSPGQGTSPGQSTGPPQPGTTSKGNGDKSDNEDDGGLSGGAVAGIVIGVLLAVVIAAAVVYVLMKGTDNIPFLKFNNGPTPRGFDGPASVLDLEKEAKAKDDRFM